MHSAHIPMPRFSAAAPPQGVENVDSATYHGLVQPSGAAMEMLRIGERRAY